MALDPIFWHRLESTGASEIGNNPTFYGSPDFIEANFFDGVDLIDATKYFEIADTFPINKGSLSMYWQPHTDSSNFRPLCNSPNAGSPQLGQIDIYMYGGRLVVYFGVDPAAITYRFTFPFSADDMIHVGLTWDGSESDGNRIKAWANGTPLTLSSIANDSTWSRTAGMTMPITKLAAYGGGNPNAIFDNVKIYNDLVTDSFAWDIANEGLEPTPSANRIWIIN